MILVDTSVWIDHLNADVHMSTDLKKTKCGNLFVIFGEPDIEVVPATDDRIQVKIKGVDLFDPRTGAIRSSETEASLAGSSIPTTTWPVSSFVTPTSLARMIHTSP